MGYSCTSHINDLVSSVERFYLHGYGRVDDVFDLYSDGSVKDSERQKRMHTVARCLILMALFV